MKETAPVYRARTCSLLFHRLFASDFWFRFSTSLLLALTFGLSDGYLLHNLYLTLLWLELY